MLCLECKDLKFNASLFIIVEAKKIYMIGEGLMSVKDILILGNPKLYDASCEIKREELPYIRQVVDDLHDTLMDFRKRNGLGRAIAAPQIDVFKRLIYMNTGSPVAFINPRMEFLSDEKFELWDDCMSFPGLFVRVLRYRRCRMYYKDLNWTDCVMDLSDDLSELLQHEYDHLDGILAVQRAVDDRSLRMEIKARG